MRILIHKSALALVAVGGVCLLPAAHAAERLTLSNGSDLLCHHHALVDGRVRAYLGAEETDYLELSPERIAGIALVPDPPVIVDLSKTVADAAVPVIEKNSPDGKLTTADLHELLAKAGSEHHVDEDLLASLVKAESGGNARAVSRAGARGLMQLMPGTARGLGVEDSFQPEDNVRGGTAYLDALLTRYHDNIALSLAAYNAGPAAVDRYHGIPPYHETRAYVARVVHEFNRRVTLRTKVSGGPATGSASGQP